MWKLIYGFKFQTFEFLWLLVLGKCWKNLVFVILSDQYVFQWQFCLLIIYSPVHNHLVMIYISSNNAIFILWNLSSLLYKIRNYEFYSYKLVHLLESLMDFLIAKCYYLISKSKLWTCWVRTLRRTFWTLNQHMIFVKTRQFKDFKICFENFQEFRIVKRSNLET